MTVWAASLVHENGGSFTINQSRLTITPTIGAGRDRMIGRRSAEQASPN
jgi:hypothetical protein